MVKVLILYVSEFFTVTETLFGLEICSVELNRFSEFNVYIFYYLYLKLNST